MEDSFVGDDHAAIVRSVYDAAMRTMHFEATISAQRRLVETH